MEVLRDTAEERLHETKFLYMNQQRISFLNVFCPLIVLHLLPDTPNS